MLQLHSRLMALVTAAFIVPATLVLACEGDCIVGITNALLGNYTTPMNTALTEIVKYLLHCCLSRADASFFLSRTAQSMTSLAQSLPSLHPSSAPS